MCSSHLYTLVLVSFSSTVTSVPVLMSMNFHVFMFSFSHVTTWKFQFIFFPSVKEMSSPHRCAGEKKDKNMIQFPLPSKKYQK